MVFPTEEIRRVIGKVFGARVEIEVVSWRNESRCSGVDVTELTLSCDHSATLSVGCHEYIPTTGHERTPKLEQSDVRDILIPPQKQLKGLEGIQFFIRGEPEV